MKLIAGVFLFAATGMAQALLAPVGNRDVSLVIKATTAASSAYRPMTRSERWHQYTHDNLTGPGAYLRSLNAAAFGVIQRRSDDWPGTTAGFAQRFGSNFGRNAVQGTITDSLAAMLGHDTRYLPCQCESTGERLKYAVKMSFLTRNQSGRKVLDISKFAGIYGGSLAMTSWRPHQMGLPAYSAEITGFRIGTSVIRNVAREFTPELKRMMPRRR